MMMNNIFDNPVWDDVADAANDAVAMTWDGCHKIYLAMDEEQAKTFAGYGYDLESPDLEILQRWFDESCGLRFVEAVHTSAADPNAGFKSLIPQFYFEDEEDEA